METVNPAILPTGALTSQAERDLERLASTPRQLADLVLGHRAGILRIKADRMISAIGQQQQTEQAQAAGLAEVDRLLAVAGGARDRLGRAIAAALAEDLPTAEATLRELRDQRLWGRLQGLLSADGDAATLVARLADAGDRDALRVLRDELPWLEMQRGPGVVEGVLTLIDQAELPLLSPAQRRARLLQAELADGWRQLLQAVEWVRHEVSGQGTATVIPGWEKGKTIRVETPLPLPAR